MSLQHMKGLFSSTSRSSSTQSLKNKYNIKVIDSIQEYRKLRQEWKNQGLSVGFVPTMGALHEGHLSLVHLARYHCDKVVSSIFVNPAQFAPHEDLSKYPRTLESDIEKLYSTRLNSGSNSINSHQDSSLSVVIRQGLGQAIKRNSYTDTGVDAVFLPPVEELYPSGITLDVTKQQGTFVEVKGKSHQMEGSIRPHFFRGVATVVTKLFNIIQPSHAFFGQKDAQQCAVIQSMVKDLFFPINMIIGVTVRHEDGLAMSSRNRYLSPEERSQSVILYKGLMAGNKVFELGNTTTEDIINAAKDVIESESGVQSEYLSLAHPVHLTEYQGHVDPKHGAIFSGAVKVGNTRIIDNILLGINVEKWGH